MNKLISKAIQMMKIAQAPYSNYSVGAAIKIDEKTIVGGCNIENASYPLSMCAERTALFSAIAQGHRQFVSMAIATKTGGTPCGSCRQVIWEYVETFQYSYVMTMELLMRHQVELYYQSHLIKII